MTAAPHRATYWLPGGFAVEFDFDGQRLDAEWSPDFPDARIGRKLLPAYRAARDHFLAGLGINVAVVEL